MQAADEGHSAGNGHAIDAAESASKIDQSEAQNASAATEEKQAEIAEESAEGGDEQSIVDGAVVEDDSTAKRKRSDSQPEVHDNDAKRAYTEAEEAPVQPPSVDYTAHLTQFYQNAGEMSAIPAGLPVMELAVVHSETLADGQIRELIDCPQDKVGSLIGTRGAVIQDMQTRCGCKIYIDQNFPEGAPRKIILTGARVAVDHAKQLIGLVMHDGPTALHMLQGPVVQQTIDCPQHLVGRVIGASGGTIRDLQSRCGCKIQIDQNFPEGHPRKITFTGSAEAVSLGIYMVQQVMEHGPSVTMMAPPGAPQPMGGMQPAMQPGMQPYGMPGAVDGMGAAPVQAPPGPGIPIATRDGTGTIYPPTTLGNGMQHQVIECAKVLVGRIIGRGGETINLIQQKSQCRVQIDQKVPDGVPCKINLQGVPGAVQLAADLVQEVMTSGPGRLHFMPSYQPMPTQGYYGGYSAQPMYGYQQQAGGYPQGQTYGAQQPYPVAAYGGQPQAAGGYPQAAYPQAGQQAYGQPQQQYQQPSAAASPGAAAGSVWSEHTTDDGNKYWYNAQTGQSQWERPAGF